MNSKKKIKRVILHIGTIKTGTSSIQETLGSNREILLEHDIYYPKCRPYNHLFEFSPLFFDNPGDLINLKKKSIIDENAITEICSQLRQKWINEIESCDCSTFIFSAENMSLPAFTPSAIARQNEFLSDFFEEIEIIVYLRHFTKLIPSEIQQTVKNGLGSVTFEKLLKRLIEKKDSRLLYSNNLDKWIDFYGRDAVKIRPFDTTVFQNGNLIRDFLFTAGYNFEKISLNEVKTNESLGGYAVSFLERLNRAYPVLVDGKVNPERGMSSRHIPEPIFNINTDIDFKPIINFSDKWAKKLNTEIDYANSMFEDGYRFKPLEASDDSSIFPRAEDIPVSWYVELINNYNKKMEHLLNKNDKLNIQKENIKRIADNALKSKLKQLYYLKAGSKFLIFKNFLLWFYYKAFGLPEFDEAYYVSTYPYVKDRAKDAMLHFLVRGVYRGYNPNFSFDTERYILEHPEIIISGENALLHSLKLNR